MAIKISATSKVFDVFNFLFLSLLMVITIYPILHVAFASISDGVELMAHTGLLLRPLGFSIDGYKRVLENPMITSGYINTLYIVIVGVMVNIFLTSLGAYALSRKSLYYRKNITLFIVFTMYFHGGLIPFYLTVKDFGLYNNLWALIIPGAISTYNLIIMRSSFQGIPDSLEESAKIDGANDFVILFRIILPLSKAVIAVMVLYYGVSHWNSWFHAMIFLRDRKLFPLQVVLREILLQNDAAGMAADSNSAEFVHVSETIKYATIMVATLPILFVYPFLQKYFVKGVMVGAIKG